MEAAFFRCQLSLLYLTRASRVSSVQLQRGKLRRVGIHSAQRFGTCKQGRLRSFASDAEREMQRPKKTRPAVVASSKAKPKQRKQRKPAVALKDEPPSSERDRKQFD